MDNWYIEWSNEDDEGCGKALVVANSMQEALEKFNKAHKTRLGAPITVAGKLKGDVKIFMNHPKDITF